jgi:protein-tyrosine phosphatase
MYGETDNTAKVVDNLYLGDWEAALRARDSQIDTLCVIEALPEDRYKGMTYYVPILDYEEEYGLATLPPRAQIHALDECCKIIDRYAEIKGGEPLLVHCWAGVERSPLTVAYWLVKSRHKANLDEAYKYLKSIRPIVEDRRNWLPYNLAVSL